MHYSCSQHKWDGHLCLRSTSAARLLGEESVVHMFALPRSRACVFCIFALFCHLSGRLSHAQAQETVDLVEEYLTDNKLKLKKDKSKLMVMCKPSDNKDDATTTAHGKEHRQHVSNK